MDILHELIPSPANFAWAVIGSLATLLVTHFLAKDRDKANRREAAQSAAKSRRRGFLFFLRGWRADFDHLHMRQTGYSRSGAAFIDVVPTFVQQADIIRADLAGDAKKRFTELAALIAKRRGGDIVGDKDRYEQLLKDFDELISVVENATNDG